MFKTKSPGLAPWPHGEFLNTPINSVWVRRDEGSPWAFMFMLMEADGDDWVYRRFTQIRGKSADLGLRTEDGIPYLSPEIQLLYKSKDHGRQKDQDDFLRVLPHLPPAKARWLLDCLLLQHGREHPWIEEIEKWIADSRRLNR